MEGDFSLMKMGWYTVQNSSENDFLNQKLENDTYGIYYSVQFEGDAETYLWQAKSAPEEGEKYWGHIEESKSGKSLRFKKDKDAPSTTPDGKPSTQAQAQEERGDAITASMAVKLAYSQFCHVETMLPNTEEHWAMIEYMSDMIYTTIKKIGIASGVNKVFPEAEPLPEMPEDLEEEEAPDRNWNRKYNK